MLFFKDEWDAFFQDRDAYSYEKAYSVCFLLTKSVRSMLSLNKKGTQYDFCWVCLFLQQFNQILAANYVERQICLKIDYIVQSSLSKI